jgi:hypothetical protein
MKAKQGSYISVALALLLALGLALAGCGEDDDGIYSENKNSRLRVNNRSEQDLLFYINAPTEANNKPFAGVPAGKQNWGVRNAPSGLNVLFVVSQREYDLKPSDPKVAMSLMIFVDSNPVTYDVRASEEGSISLILRNISEYYVEVRENHPEGRLFLTVPKYEFGSIKYVPQGEYVLFPIVKIPQMVGNNVVSILSKFLMGGTKSFSLMPPVTMAVFDVTPGTGELGAMRSVESLIYIRNEFNNGGGAAWVHRGSAAGPQMLSTLDRTMVSVGDVFPMSWRPELSPDGTPLQATYNPVFVLRTPQGTSSPASLICEVGFAYRITCRADGTWSEPVVEPLN